VQSIYKIKKFFFRVDLDTDAELNSKWLHFLGFQIFSSGKDTLMERIHHIDKLQEGTAKTTGKAGKAGPRPWEIGNYIYQEPIAEKRSSHCDPRLELAQRSYGQHQDSGVIPSDADHGYSPPVFGSGFTHQLDVSASTAIDQGSLAGCFGRPRTSDDKKKVYSVPDSAHNVSPPQNHY
jgi:hypothetical protein